MEKCFVNQVKNGNTLTQCIIAKQPLVTTVAGPQTIYFWKNNPKRKAKASAQAHIQRFFPSVYELVIEKFF